MVGPEKFFSDEAMSPLFDFPSIRKKGWVRLYELKRLARAHADVHAFWAG